MVNQYKLVLTRDDGHVVEIGSILETPAEGAFITSVRLNRDGAVPKHVAEAADVLTGLMTGRVKSVEVAV